MRYELLEVGDIYTDDCEFRFLDEKDRNKKWESVVRSLIGKPHDGTLIVRRPLTPRITITVADPWIKASDRMPTKDDGDCDDGVVIADEDGDLFLRKWRDVAKGERWIGKAPSTVGGLTGLIMGKAEEIDVETEAPVKHSLDFQRDYIDKLEGTDAVLWGCWSEEHREGIRKEWEAKIGK